jgi:AsmA protein
MGEFSVENFADPLYRFELRADRIDADRYLPPKAAPDAEPDAASAAKAPAAAAPAGASAERRLGDIRLRNDALTATRLIGSASVGELKIGGMRFQQLATDLAIGDGRAALTSVRTQLYGGEFTGGVEIDTTGAIPALHLNGPAISRSISGGAARPLAKPSNRRPDRSMYPLPTASWMASISVVSCARE